MEDSEFMEYQCLQRRKDIEASNRLITQSQAELDDLGDTGDELTGINYQDLTVQELHKVTADQKHRLTCFMAEYLSIQSELRKIKKIIKIKTK